MKVAVQARALLSAVPAGPAAAALTERRGQGQALPSLPVGGTVLTREETAAALFEAETDCYGMPGLTTDALYEIAGRQVRSMTPADFAKLTDDFAALDSGEFPEVGQCRWYAYRLHLSFWYHQARTRPVTTGEAAAALCLSDWRQVACAGTSAPRALAHLVRQGASRVPTTVLMTLGTALTGELAHHGPEVPAWLADRLLPNYRRRRACYDLIRAQPRIPTPVLVRPDSGGYALGATPPPGPGNVWARPLRAVW